VTLHVPRRAYVEALRGIPTIRVFEALACGIPLVSAPWLDSENLFQPGDYVSVDSPQAMWQALHRFATDDDARAEQAERGLRSILARHTCDHRAEQLLGIVAELGRAGTAGNREQGIGNSLQQHGQADSLASEAAACT
jgi:spore maturation protein CgeB